MIDTATFKQMLNYIKSICDPDTFRVVHIPSPSHSTDSIYFSINTLQFWWMRNENNQQMAAYMDTSSSSAPGIIFSLYIAGHVTYHGGDEWIQSVIQIYKETSYATMLKWCTEQYTRYKGLTDPQLADIESDPISYINYCETNCIRPYSNFGDTAVLSTITEYARSLI